MINGNIYVSYLILLHLVNRQLENMDLERASINTVILAIKILFTACTHCKRNSHISSWRLLPHYVLTRYVPVLTETVHSIFLNADNYMTTLTFNLCALFCFSFCRASAACTLAPTLRNAHR